MNLSFAGCGFLGIYHVGVAVCFKKYAPHILVEKISGASFGAIAASCLLCDLPLGEITSDVLRVVSEARQRTLGPFSPSFNIQNVLLEGLEKFLPDDAHLRVNGKLHISLTRVYDGKNVIVSQFNSKEDLQQALLASSFIPVFSGLLPPKFHGVRYMDGGFSDNLPTIDENTITVSPFCGESDICPRDLSSQLFHVNVANTSIELSRQNIYRFARILFPPKPEMLAKMCKQGFDDALRFLHRNNLINCTRCLAVQSTFTVSESLDDSFEYDPQCKECIVHRQEALVANLPDTVLSIFQDAIDTANKGLVNWIFKHRGMKLLSVLSLPYTIPADIVFATITNILGTTEQTYEMHATLRSRPLVAGLCLRHVRSHFLGLKEKKRCMALTPKLGNHIWEVSKVFMDQLTCILYNVNMKRQQISAHITCNLAFTEYGRGHYDIESINEIPMAVKNQVNFNFTLNLDERDMSGLDPTTTRNYPRTLSRRCSSLALNRGDGGIEDDTFEHILQVTAQHEAIMAFYYMDENNKVKVTEIFDVTDAESGAVLTPEERENNTQLEFDQDWNDPLNNSVWQSQHTLVGEDDYEENSVFDSSSEVSWDEDNVSPGDSGTIFSDPESEWNADSANLTTKTPNLMLTFSPPDLLPESDQISLNSGLLVQPLTRKPSFVIMDE